MGRINVVTQLTPPHPMYLGLASTLKDYALRQYTVREEGRGNWIESPWTGRQPSPEIRVHELVNIIGRGLNAYNRKWRCRYEVDAEGDKLISIWLDKVYREVCLVFSARRLSIQGHAVGFANQNVSEAVIELLTDAIAVAAFAGKKSAYV